MRILLSILILLFGSPVNADVDLKELRSYGNGSFIVSPKVPNTLFYFGNGQGAEILSGDSLDLRKALRNEKVDKIVLYSNGGFVNEGLIMAGIIHDKGLTTVIPKGAVCLSACAYMLFAGDQRLVDGQLGVHQVGYAQDVSGELVPLGETAEGIQETLAEVLGALREFEAPRFVDEKMLQQKSMYYFSRDELNKIESSPTAVSDEESEKIAKFVSDFFDAVNKLTKSTREVDGTVERQQSDQISRKEAIILVQSKLNEIGCAAGVADGILGKRTTSAIKLFSKTAGLEYFDGIMFQEAFLERLSTAGANFCPKPKPKPAKKTTQFKLDGFWTVEAVCDENRRLYGRLVLQKSRYREYIATYSVDNQLYKGTLKQSGSKGQTISATLVGSRGTLRANGYLEDHGDAIYGKDEQGCKMKVSRN